MSNKQNDIWNENKQELEEPEEKIFCPFCHKKIISGGIICLCEVEGAGMGEYWK